MPKRQPLKLGFFASHGGSGMRAVLDAIADGDLNAEATILIANNPDCAAIRTAESAHLPWRHISVTTEGSPEAADLKIARTLADAGA